MSMRSYDPEEIGTLLDTAAQLRDEKKSRVFPRRLEHRNIAMVFLKPSCRTRVSFLVAAADEGANMESFSAEEIRFGIKESVRDVARVLGRVFEGIVFRGYDEAVLRTLVEYSGIPVWNALSDHYHPTQVLADLLTVRDVFGDLKGLPVTYVGDGRNNQARSLAIASVKMGLDFRILTADSLRPSPEELDEIRADAKALGGSVLVTADPAEALDGSAVVYGDVWASMGEENLIDERITALREFKVTGSMMAATGRDDSVYLHCLPAFHDLETDFARQYPDVREVDDDVFEGPRSRVFDQSENRMHTAKAVMVLTVR
ncbi:ornithine carbamoyltransferase [Amycolatopsis sp. NPDC059657]|uniref:ornithine carbamoyltransferase n=1 Tax=Amycolatopsis sp. NPDC059657 TaxID=3346899 RepID=UPI00366C2945